MPTEVRLALERKNNALDIPEMRMSAEDELLVGCVQQLQALSHRRLGRSCLHHSGVLDSEQER